MITKVIAAGALLLAGKYLLPKIVDPWIQNDLEEHVKARSAIGHDGHNIAVQCEASGFNSIRIFRALWQLGYVLNLIDEDDGSHTAAVSRLPGRYVPFSEKPPEVKKIVRWIDGG